jgi:FkbH-like protein
MPSPAGVRPLATPAQHPTRRPRIAVSATFTTEPLEPSLRFWGRRLGSDFEIRFAPYNQLPQTLHDPASEFARNPDGLNLMLARLEDLGQFHRFDEMALAQIGRNLDHLVQGLKEARGHFSAPVLWVLCPPSPPFIEEASRGAFARAAAARCKEALKGVGGVQVLDWDDVGRLCPVADPHNPDGERLGRIPYTDLFFAALGTVAVRWWDALTRAPYKVIAVDCDNTLWAGICGEDGPEGVVLDPARRRLHEFLLAQRDAGMLLAMASKNNEQEVLETFAAHPEFPLRPEHFAAWRINWEAKADNLAGLAATLNVGLDSFIFLDDNPKECAEVAEGAPDVLSLALPEPIDLTLAWLGRVWAFDHPIVTAEDRQRSAYYEQGRAFTQAARTAASLEDFMRKLGLVVQIAPLNPEHLARAAQLTQRTNQFNTTTVRRTEADLASLAASPQGAVFTASVIDRFGEYGLTGLMVTEQRDTELWIESLLLSCRVLGRGVEHRLLRFAGQQAFDLGLERVVVPFVPTSRNAPARQFLDSLSTNARTADGEAIVYHLNAEELAKLEWKPNSAQHIEPAAVRPTPRPLAPRRFNGYAAIAAELGTAENVLEAIRHEARALLAGGPGADAPASDIELKLAAIWAELLRKPHLRLTDNFFDLGGHSLLAVLLIMRIKEELGVELAVDDVYSATLTLGELAQLVEAKQAGGLAADEYEALLKEIEGLSEDEVRALLEQEGLGEASQG